MCLMYLYAEYVCMNADHNVYNIQVLDLQISLELFTCRTQLISSWAPLTVTRLSNILTFVNFHSKLLYLAL